jgi:DNA-binding GntR family transcriptional regulator
VYRAIRADILNGELVPGAKLGMADLGQRYEVSSGVLREVLPRLVAEGLAVSEAQLGFRVVSVTVDDLLHITQARLLIETQTLRYAIEAGDTAWEAAVVASLHLLSRTTRIDDDGRINPEWLDAHAHFHQTLLDGCPNQPLRAIALSLRDSSEVYRYWARKRSRQRGRNSLAEHQLIAELSIQRDADGAVAALTRHIQTTADTLIEDAAEAGADTAHVMGSPRLATRA